MPPPGNGGMSVAGVDLQSVADSVADVFVLPGRIMGSNHNNTNVVNVSDPTALLHQQLASALSTIGDAQYWEESISPATVRDDLERADPSNPSHAGSILRSMKWLLACISKGRDVSDFYAPVVKLVGCVSLEARKMVYMF